MSKRILKTFNRGLKLHHVTVNHMTYNHTLASQTMQTGNTITHYLYADWNYYYKEEKSNHCNTP